MDSNFQLAGQEGVASDVHSEALWCHVSLGARQNKCYVRVHTGQVGLSELKAGLFLFLWQVVLGIGIRNSCAYDLCGTAFS